jgi:hypothetical protein
LDFPKTAIRKSHWFVCSNFNIPHLKRKQKLFFAFGQNKSRRRRDRDRISFENRTGDKPHPGRARSARHTAQTLAIFANRRRKNRKIFGKFECGKHLQPSSNIFSRKLLKKVLVPPRFRPQIFKKFASQNRKIFFSFFFKFRAPQLLFLKEKEKISVLEFRRIGTAEAKPGYFMKRQGFLSRPNQCADRENESAIKLKKCLFYYILLS